MTSIRKCQLKCPQPSLNYYIWKGLNWALPCFCLRLTLIPEGALFFCLLLTLKVEGEVLLRWGSGKLNSSPCRRQQLRSHYNYRPRIPRAQGPWELSRRLLRFVARGAGPFWRHFHVPCKPHHQLAKDTCTRHDWRWNTTVCSTRGNCRCEEHHSRRHAVLFCLTAFWKDIPEQINK